MQPRRRLSALVEAAAAGAEIIIVKAGRPVPRLGPLPRRFDRRPGRLKELVRVHRCFDDALPAEIARAFE